MNLGPAARGFLALLLSAPALKGNNDLENTACALRGSTLEISCDYDYPNNGQDSDTTETLWLTKQDRNTLIDIRIYANYGGRVEYSCGDMRCTGSKCHRTCVLKIKDLGESDSAEYKFRIRRNQPAEEYSCYPGLNLSVTDLQVKLAFLHSDRPNVVDLECHSRCDIASPSYKWFRNGQHNGQGRYYKGIINSQDSYSCAVEEYEHLQTPSVYAPKSPSVTVSPSGEIVEGSSVTLSCSTDANPAANYTWFKVNTYSSFSDMNQRQQLVFIAIQSSNSGQYSCQANNELGEKSVSIPIDVKYAPKTPSVTMSPSGEIVEGSSVTLSCSTDANPAANYTWFKEHEDSVVESGQNYTITNITSELGGHFYCQTHNAIGRRNSTLLFVNVTDCIAASSSSLTTAVAVRISVCSLVSILLFLFFLWIGKWRPYRRASGLGEAAELPGEEEEVRDRNEGL